MSKLSKLIFPIQALVVLIALISCKLEHYIKINTNAQTMDKEYIFKTPKEKLTAKADGIFKILMPNDTRDTSRSFVFNLYCESSGVIDTVFLEADQEPCNNAISKKLIEMIISEKKVNPILYKGKPIKKYEVLIRYERYRTVIASGPMERPE